MTIMQRQTVFVESTHAYFRSYVDLVWIPEYVIFRHILHILTNQKRWEIEASGIPSNQQ